MTKLYQLAAHGNMAFFSSTSQIHSRCVFRTHLEAEEYIPDFTKNVTAPKSDYDLTYLEDNKNLKVVILELELEGEIK